MTDMSWMFNNCRALSFLPDISKWNTQNIIDISHIFGNCRELSIL